MSTAPRIIHKDDHPATLDLILRLCAGRPGFERTSNGAIIDWDEMVPGTFSTSEVAVAHIARGLAILEAHGGGAPAKLRRSLSDAIEAVL